MYDKLEDALESLEYIRNHSQFSDRLWAVLDMAKQDILEYIEEGYRMKEEVTTLGD